MTMRFKPPTEGLDRHHRLALCDAANGPLGQWPDSFGLYRRAVMTGHAHAPAVVAALVAKGLLKVPGEGFAAITPLGRRLAARLRARHRAIELYERALKGADAAAASRAAVRDARDLPREIRPREIRP